LLPLPVGHCWAMPPGETSKTMHAMIRLKKLQVFFILNSFMFRKAKIILIPIRQEAVVFFAGSFQSIKREMTTSCCKDFFVSTCDSLI
jgi:hypothetical protein